MKRVWESLLSITEWLFNVYLSLGSQNCIHICLHNYDLILHLIKWWLKPFLTELLQNHTSYFCVPSLWFFLIECKSGLDPWFAKRCWTLMLCWQRVRVYRAGREAINWTLYYTFFKTPLKMSPACPAVTPGSPSPLPSNWPFDSGSAVNCMWMLRLPEQSARGASPRTELSTSHFRDGSKYSLGGKSRRNLPTGIVPFCDWAEEHTGRWKDYYLIFYCLIWTSSKTWTFLIFFVFTLPQCCLVAVSSGGCIKERCSDFLWYFGFLGCPISYLQDFTLLNLSYLCCDLFIFILILTVLALASVSVDQMKPGKLLLPSMKMAFVMEVHPAKSCPETPKPSNVGGLFKSSMRVMVTAVNLMNANLKI